MHGGAYVVRLAASIKLSCELTPGLRAPSIANSPIAALDCLDFCLSDGTKKGAQIFPLARSALLNCGLLLICSWCVLSAKENLSSS